MTRHGEGRSVGINKGSEEHSKTDLEQSGIREIPNETPESKSLEQKNAMTKEERREWHKKMRETVGAEARAKYLEPTPTDSEQDKAYKKWVSGLDLEQTVGDMVDGDQERVAQTLAEIGLEKKTYDTKNKKGEITSSEERWSLKNPDPKARAAGSFADPTDMKAFVVGYALAKTMPEKLRVIGDVYRYMGIDAPEINETADALEDEMELSKDGNESAEDNTPTQSPERPESTTSVEGKKQITLADHNGALKKMRSLGKKIVVGMSLLLAFNALSADHGSARHDSRLDGDDSLSTLDHRPGPAEDIQPPEKSSSDATDMPDNVHHLVKGESVAKVVKDMLGKKADSATVRAVIKEELRLNGVHDSNYGVDDGPFDSAKLPVGSAIDIGPILKHLANTDAIDATRTDIAKM